MQTITAIMGDGIGPEVMESAIKVVNATKVEINWERVYAGTTALEKFGSPLPQTTIDSILRNTIALKGPCNTPVGDGFQSVNVQLRKIFNLHLNLRPVRSLRGVRCLHDNVDLLVCRENIEELYTGNEKYIWDSKTKEIIGAKIIGEITYEGSRKFFRSVFMYISQFRRKKVTVLHKANILKLTNGIFLETAKEVASLYPEIEFEERIIDTGSMWVVMDPSKFDVIATTNLFGDIVSDVFAGLAGGLGVAPGANIGSRYAIFEAVHGTWPQAAGKNLANPTAVILSAAMMLDHIEEYKAARRIRWAVESVIAEGKKVTCDLNPDGVGTTDMTKAIIEKIEASFDLEAESCA